MRMATVILGGYFDLQSFGLAQLFSRGLISLAVLTLSSLSPLLNLLQELAPSALYPPPMKSKPERTKIGLELI